MVRRAQGAYSDAVKWTKLGRPRRLNGTTFSGHCFQNSFVTGVVVLGVIGLLSPATYGQTRGFSAQGQIGGLGLGWPALVLAGLVLGGIVYALVHRNGIRWTVVRVVDPWRRPMQDHDSYDGAVGALDACPETLRSRYAMRFVYKPPLLAVLATFFAFSSAYFLVDAILAQFVVGWQQPLLAVVNAVLSVVLWRVAAVPLSTWRLAVSVHKTVATGYV